MIFIDTSVFVAISALEPDRATLIEAIESAERRLTSPFIRLETSIVLATRLARLPREAEAQFDKFLVHSDVVEVDSYTIGRDCSGRLFRGVWQRTPSCAIEFRNCLRLRERQSLRARLLFKGDDFAKTDVNSWI